MSKDELLPVRPDVAGDGEEEGGDNFLKYLHAIINHRWIILTFVAVAFAFSTFHNYKLPDYYVATAKVLVHKVDDEKLSPYAEAAETQILDISYFETQVVILRGPAVCRRAAEELNLMEHYGTKNNFDAGRALMGRVSSTLMGKTRILSVSVNDGDPEWAAKIANAMVDAYVKESMKDRMFVSDQILKWFPNNSQGVQQSEAMDLLKKIDDRETAEKMPSIANDPAIRGLKMEKIAIEARIRELLTRYTPEHPQIKELTGRLDFLDNEIRIQVDRLTASLKTALAGEFNVSNIKILERANVPPGPAGPNRRKAIMMATALGLAAGIALAIFLDSMDKSIKTDEDILGIPGLPFLGSVPIIDSNKKGASGKSGGRTLEEFVAHGSISDAMTSLNTALLFSMPKGQNKRIMVTSSIPGEGKSTMSYMLAVSMAKLGSKVLCVELDLRRPSLSQKVSMKVDTTKGIADYLVGQAALEDVVHTSPAVPTLDIIFAGRVSPNPTTLFTSAAFDDFLKTAELKYDRIIIDSPPSLQIPDPIILSNKVHGVVFVIGSHMVSRKIVLKTINKFRFVGSTIFGAIINRINYKKTDLAGYHSYYGKYYGKYVKPLEKGN